MKSLWLAVLVLCVMKIKAEDSGVLGYELVMGALKTMQSNIHALEQALTSVGTKVDQTSAKVDNIVAEQSKLTKKLADNMRTTASQMDKLRDGIQSNSKAMESSLKSVITKVDHLMADKRLSKMATKVDSVMTEQSKLAEKISNHSITAASQTDKLMTGMESNGRSLENSLKSVITKVDRLIGDQRLSTLSTKVDGIITATTNTEQMLNMTVGESSCPNHTGVYLLRPPGSSSFQVYCENGWIVIQSRINGNLSFDRNWNEYRNGFGDLKGDHWLGLEKMHQITRGGSYELMVVLRNSDGEEKRAKYTEFEIAGEEEQYWLDLKAFSNGYFSDGLTMYRRMRFSTPDRDNDVNLYENCAKKSNSGWWFSFCYHSNLNEPTITWSFTTVNKPRMMIRQIN